MATVVFIGHFVLLSVIYLPVFAKSDNSSMLSEISKRSRPWMYASLIIFIVTGMYLMIVDPNYGGVGNFGNLWAIMMLIKHILIIAMIGMGFFFNAILHVGPMTSSNRGASQAIDRFRNCVNLMAVAGVIVLLLTAFAQAK
jgi:uncharacterized membrane protein